ncbi:UDP-glucuronic acid decarboxylase family protein [Cellulosilyticum ruminicola]|uniref:UDP-glucuronic acid decarboxylase family protein n=1 Tax=Cellulosilyticum ruminicola TaxID=425254 RepID=UPI0006CFFE76|nr:UDP-glucuronic acid decarboxylase family protein [Cellulosilyticum ruminicola]
MKKKLILVTGGAGFLGSNLCKVLVEQGNYVVCIDNLYTGRKENIVDLMEKENFIFINHDIIQPINLDTVFSFKSGDISITEVEQIYNLACPASPIHYQKDPIQTLKTSVWGIMNMLAIAKKTNATILQASTSEVYGDAQITPQNETYHGNVNTIGIRACYDEGKRVAETLLFDYHRMYNVNIKVMRIFNTYGPNMDPLDGRVVSNFIVQALRNDDITVYGDGEQTRSFCYVTDLIEGMMRLMNSNDTIHGPVNIGNPGEFTVKQLADLVIELTGSKSKIIYMPLPQDDPCRRRPDITLAKEKLNWEPKIQLKEGIEKTMQYFKEII